MLALIMFMNTTILGPRSQRPIVGRFKLLVHKPIPVGQPRDDACRKQAERDEADGFNGPSMRLPAEHRHAPELDPASNSAVARYRRQIWHGRWKDTPTIKISVA